MATAEQHFDALAQHIDNLNPDEMGDELSSILGGNVGRGALSGAISRHSIDPSHPNDPMIDLLEAIRTKIGQDGDDKLRTQLGGQAINSVTAVFRSNEFKPGTHEQISALANEAEKFADLMDDPDEKSDRLLRLAQALADINPRFTDHEDSLFAIGLSGEYLDKAAKAVGNIKEDYARPYRLHKIAQQSVLNAGAAARLFGTQYEGSEELPASISEQPVRLYREAFAASDAEEELDEIYAAHVNENESAVSLLNNVSDAELRDTVPELYEALVGIALERIDKFILLSESKEDSLNAAWQANLLAESAADISLMLGEKYYDKGSTAQEKPLISRLEKQAFTLFQASLDKMQSLESSESGTPHHHQRSSRAAMTAARVWAERDLPKTAELIDIACGLARAEDADGDIRGRSSIVMVVDEVDLLARTTRNRKDALSLYSRVDALLEASDPDENITEARSSNASSWIFNLHPGDKAHLLGGGNLTEADRAFVIYAATEVGNYLAHVEQVGEIFPDDDEITQAISKRAKKMHAEVEKKKRPKSQTERLAQELIQSL